MRNIKKISALLSILLFSFPLKSQATSVFKDLALAFPYEGKIRDWRLTIWESGEQPTIDTKKITSIVCEDAKSFPVKRVVVVKGREKCNKKSTEAICAGNGETFEFQQLDEKVGTCFLVTKEFIDTFDLLRLEPAQNLTCPQDLVAAISKDKKRKVANCEISRSISAGVFGFAVFEEKPKDKLATMFFSNAKDRVYYDHATTEDWRVGGGGKFDTTGFSFHWALKNKKTGDVGLAYTWSGGEGDNVYLNTQEGQNFVNRFHEYIYYESN